MEKNLQLFEKNSLKIGLIALFMLFALTLQAQTVVTGVVKDGIEDIPLPGVSVYQKGSGKVSITDLDGAYKIEVSDAQAELIFSFIGFESQNIVVGNRTTIDITLVAEETLLEQVVVVGYGTQKKINLTGAVDQVSGEDIVNRPVGNVMQSLQGVSPGLNITYSGGRPGSIPNINIRGFTSINGGGPLIVIDGVAAAYDDLLRLNPADIESFSVLRDAASAAIYGARAAFGVVLITTKQGGSKQVISYNSNFSWGKPTVMPQPVTDPYIYSRVMDQATSNTPWNYINFNDYHYSWAKERSEDPSVEDVRVDPNNPNQWAYMGNNDWYDYFFNGSSFSTNQSLSISGSSNNEGMPMTYYVSGDYTRENGMNKLQPDNWDRYSLRARLTATPKKWLKLDNNLNIYQTKREESTNNITDIYSLTPIEVAENPDGTWANTDAGRLAARLVDGGRNVEDMFGFHNIFRAIGTFLEGDLTVTGNASFKREQWVYGWNTKSYNIGFGPDDVRTEGGDGAVVQRNGSLQNTIFDLYSNYTKTFGDHTISLLAGYNQESYSYSSVQSERRVLISSSLPYIGLTTGDSFITPGYSSYATQSVFGRANYTYDNKYILEFNGRYDGSSRFPSSSRWGFFPSLSGAWIISDEGFLNDFSSDPTLKLRASYGSLGNQNVSNFGYLQSLPTELSSYLIDNNRQVVVSSSPLLAVDPNFYTWERVVTTNFGLDFGLWEDRFFATFDYFIRDTKDMLTNPVELPGVLGTSPPQQNAADLQTKGWELSLNYRNQFGAYDKPIEFTSKFFVSDSRSYITRFENEQGLFSNYRVGEEVGEIWGLTNDGLFTSEDEISQLDQSAIIPWGALDIVPGWPKYVDLNNDGKIEEGLSANDPKDLKLIGNSSARYQLGANLSLAWNGFDFSLFLQGVGKQDYYPRHYLFWGPYQQPYANIYPWNLDFYRGEADSDAMRAQHSQSYLDAGLADVNTDSSYPVLQSWLADANYGSGLDISQTGYLLNAAYVRVKNVTIGYNLPEHWVSKVKASRIRVFASGENLYEFSAIKSFLDSEAINGGNGWAYPFQRKLSFGVNIDL
ncbi:SusC/RagA family TonB-linked outer membrane protein [Cyclobacterium marinum]|uniref:SusC/RagA family TonB-linked outer membrane protein n=1 Tax=Cyclobacterium marinum TaxID=104 RepID=UPI0011EC9EAA|nr:TonB-dependent receptor [Cyclobacterium marinum]MBI0397401.1 TonB-dependent receptor [Cyclobacterium marinum]